MASYCEEFPSYFTVARQQIGIVTNKRGINMYRHRDCECTIERGMMIGHVQVRVP